MAPNNQNAFEPYKQCAGRGCSKEGINYLKILFINKCGWFCEYVDADIKWHGLVKEQQNNTDLGLCAQGSIRRRSSLIPLLG